MLRLIRFFARLFGLGKGGNARADTYLPAERLIYRYFNGSKVIAADPVLLFRGILGVGPELSAEIKIARSPSAEAPKAHADAVAKVRNIFKAAPLSEDGTGLGDQECLDLLDHFLIYCDGLKKNMSPTVTSPEETSAPTPSSSGGSPPTGSTPDSGSTGTAPASGGPETPPSGTPSAPAA